MILLTDLIVDHGVKIEWSAYLHLLLHAIFIGKPYAYAWLQLFVHLLEQMSTRSVSLQA